MVNVMENKTIKRLPVFKNNACLLHKILQPTYNTMNTFKDALVMDMVVLTRF